MVGANWCRRLIEEGGRPLHSADRLADTAYNSSAHHALLRPWAKDPDASSPNDWYEVFAKQLRSWRHFRTWQRDNRGLWDEDEEFVLFREELRRNFIDESQTKMLEEQYFNNLTTRRWQGGHPIRQRRWRRKYVKEDTSGEGFLGYLKASTRRLKHHGFTQHALYHEDAHLQDKWTTWVEYIGFVCWELDNDIDAVERLQSTHDAAWQVLVESGVLRETDTPENAWTNEACSERAQEAVRADRAVVAAGGPANQTEEQLTSGNETEKSAKSSRLQEAEASLLVVTRRRKLMNVFTKKTRRYHDTQRDVRHRKAALEWLMDQASQLWIEEQEKMRRTSAQDSLTATSNRKRACSTGDRDVLAKVNERRRAQDRAREGRIATNSRKRAYSEGGPGDPEGDPEVWTAPAKKRRESKLAEDSPAATSNTKGHGSVHDQGGSTESTNRRSASQVADDGPPATGSGKRSRSEGDQKWTDVFNKRSANEATEDGAPATGSRKRSRSEGDQSSQDTLAKPSKKRRGCDDLAATSGRKRARSESDEAVPTTPSKKWRGGDTAPRTAGPNGMDQSSAATCHATQAMEGKTTDDASTGAVSEENDAAGVNDDNEKDDSRASTAPHSPADPHD